MIRLAVEAKNALPGVGDWSFYKQKLNYKWLQYTYELYNFIDLLQLMMSYVKYLLFPHK